VANRLRKLVDEDEDDEMAIFQHKEEEGAPDDIECSPMLIAGAALCLAIVTFLLALVAAARVEVDQLAKACTDVGLQGWASPNFNITQQQAILGMGNSTGTVLSPGIQTLAYNIAPDGTKEFYLYAQPVNQMVMNLADIANHQKIIPGNNWVDTSGYTTNSVPYSNMFNNSVYAWGYNGQTPGPVIEVNLGDTIRIYLFNELPESTSLHLHGILHAWEDDGMAGVNEAPIPPQGQRNYTLTITQCGTFTYHSGYQMWKQDTRGLFGMFVSHCPGAEPQADKDYSLVVSASTLLNDHDSRNCPAWWRTYTDWFLFNGHASPSIPIMHAKSGDVVRIRLVNPFDADSYPVYIHGHQWTLISAGGSAPLDPSLQMTGSTINLAAGLAQDILFTARVGIWAIHSHTSYQTVNFLPLNSIDPTQLAYYGGMYTLLCVDGITPRGTNITCY